MRVRKKDVMGWTDEEVAWIAGVIEAKGTLTQCRGKVNDYPRVHVQAKLKDADVIENLHFLVGGTITHKKVKSGTRYIQLNMGRRDEIQRLFGAIYPWMGQRRQDKIDELLGR